MNRRHFLAAAGAGAALTMLNPSLTRAAAPKPALDNLGIQLYTLRDLMAQDVPGTLKALAGIGYKKVEFAGYFGLEHAAVRDLLAETGLIAPSTHATLGQLRESIDDWIGACLGIGHDYLVCSWMTNEQRSSLDGWRGIVHELNHFGEKCRDAGIQFAYHNHDFEFEPLDGSRPYDLILGDTDPALVKLELDWYWTAFAGVDTAALMRAHADRFRLFHLKDMAADRQMADPGEGTLPFADLIGIAQGVGGEHFYVERDNPSDALATARSGFAFLSGL